MDLSVPVKVFDFHGYPPVPATENGALPPAVGVVRPMVRPATLSDLSRRRITADAVKEKYTDGKRDSSMPYWRPKVGDCLRQQLAASRESQPASQALPYR
jgi:hypothetical protein